jgi:MbtH protein
MSDEPRYTVVTNDAGDYSIWPAGRELPTGWRLSDFTGTEAECAEHVDRVWTGLTPDGLRARRAG